MSRPSSLALLGLVALVACASPSPSTEPPVETCEPECADRACGDDGCGGSCGTCGTGTACSATGTCDASACPAGAQCLEAVYTAVAYACTPLAAWSWDCTPLAAVAQVETAALCRMTCRGGESACNEADTSVGAECRACEASCAAGVETLCPAEAPGTCPAPCACR